MPPAPPVIKIVLLVSFIIKYLLSYVTIYKSHVDETAQKVDGRSSNKHWVGSINFVNAAGLRAQDSAFVGLSNFPSFDRNHADEELGKLRFGFFQHRGTHHIDTQSLRKLNCGSPNKSFQRARDG